MFRMSCISIGLGVPFAGSRQFLPRLYVYDMMTLVPDSVATETVSVPAATVITPHIAYYFRTKRDIQNGLMGVRHLAPDSVALFDMGHSDNHKFYMRDTLIPLDIIFIRDDGLVVGVLENMRPFDLKSKSVGAKSRYVIEALAGYSQRYSITPGTTRVTLPGITYNEG